MAPANVPQLRGAGKRAWGIALVSSLTASALFAVWFKKNVVEARKKHYKEFYDNYDDDKEYEKMKQAGIFKGFENAA